MRQIKIAPVTKMLDSCSSRTFSADFESGSSRDSSCVTVANAVRYCTTLGYRRFELDYDHGSADV